MAETTSPRPAQGSLQVSLAPIGDEPIFGVVIDTAHDRVSMTADDARELASALLVRADEAAELDGVDPGGP